MMFLTIVTIFVLTISRSTASDYHTQETDFDLLDVSSPLRVHAIDSMPIEIRQRSSLYRGDVIDILGDGGWGEWTSWGPCTRTCGAGLSKRTRICQRSAVGKSQCHESNIETKICSDLPNCESSKDFRHYQCTQHNNVQMFHLNTFNWLPYHEEDFPTCTLTCTPENYNFFHPFGDALDGTSCGVATRGVCISGVCKNVGCDGIIDSSVVYDSCGVCGGDNSSCYNVHEVFDQYEPGITVNEYDYNKIQTIETGASNIVIKDYSQNYLAIAETNGDSKNFIINGDFMLSHNGSFEMSGMSLKYERYDDNEVVTIKGPIERNIDIMILNFGSDPLVEYEYFVSLGRKVAYGAYKKEDKLVVPDKIDTIEELLQRGFNESEIASALPTSSSTTTSTTLSTTTTTTISTTTKYVPATQTSKPEKCSCIKTQFAKRKNFCTSDFVVRARILYKQRGYWGKYSRYLIEISNIFKSGFSLLKREYVWIANSCCTKLRPNRYFVLSGRKVSFNANRKVASRSVSRLLIDFSDYWVPWKKPYQRKLGKLSKRKLCKRRRSVH